MFLRLKRLFCRCLLLWGLLSVGIDAGEIRFTVLASADLHGRLTVLEQAVAPLVRERTAQRPGHVIYCDLGDAGQGNFRLWRAQGKDVMHALAQAGCTFWVPGNHDLDFGSSVFQKMIEEFPGTVLAGNLRGKVRSDKVRDYAVVECEGVRIALIGLMLEKWSPAYPAEAAQIQILPGRRVLSKIVEAVADCDAVILLRHAGNFGGGENLSSLLSTAPEIDLTIGSHTHQGKPGKRAGSAWYVQPPSHGEGLAEVELIFDENTHELKQMESRIRRLPEIPEPVFAEELLPAPAIPENDPEMLARKMMQSLQSDCALLAIGSDKAWKTFCRKSDPTRGDYFELFPYGDQVVVLDVAPDELRAIVLEYARFAKKRKQRLLGAGFSWQEVPGNGIKLAMEKDQTHYRLAITLYAAGGCGGNLPAVRRILEPQLSEEKCASAPALLDLLY